MAFQESDMSNQRKHQRKVSLLSNEDSEMPSVHLEANHNEVSGNSNQAIGNRNTSKELDLGCGIAMSFIVVASVIYWLSIWWGHWSGKAKLA